MILAKVSELTRELGARRAVPGNTWTKVWDLRNEYETVDQSLRQVMAPGPRAIITHASNIGGSRNFSAGLGPTRQQNVDPSNVGSSVGLPNIPTSVAGPYAPPPLRPSFPSAQRPYALPQQQPSFSSVPGQYAPPPQRPSFPSAQVTTLVPTSGGNAGGGPRPKHTEFCGVVVAAPNASTIPAPRANDQGQRNYKFCCVICNEAFRDQRRVYSHFSGCVKRNGNVNGAHWYDHPSINETKLPYGLLEEVWK